MGDFVWWLERTGSELGKSSGEFSGLGILENVERGLANSLTFP